MIRSLVIGVLPAILIAGGLPTSTPQSTNGRTLDQDSGSPQSRPNPKLRRDDGLAAPRIPSFQEVMRLQGKEPQTTEEMMALQMSAMGAIAAGVAPWPDVSTHMNAPDGYEAVLELIKPTVFELPLPLFVGQIGSKDQIINNSLGVPNGGQAETTIAINDTGLILIAGYNDSRGFNAAPTSLSGVARSTDGGATWTEVPVGPGGSGRLPTVVGGSVFGDPDVKFDKVNNRFIYSSIYVRPSDGRQGLCIHVSNSTGTTWTGPIEVTPSFIAGASADKEFIDVHPETGRILVTWSNFAASISILSTFSDDGGATWSPIQTLITDNSAQAALPRFGKATDYSAPPASINNSTRTHVVWSNRANPYNESAAVSLDGGATWAAPANITTGFTPVDQIVGLDRVNSFPSMSVDRTNGNVYVVYQRNNSLGTGDIAFQRSTDGGATWSSAVLLDADPGNDGAQFYPWVTVDQGTQKVHVEWYDQGYAATGDLGEIMHTTSSDGGLTWTPPTPLSDRPFHMGYGNDTSQPNLGDYHQAVAQSGVTHSVFAGTSVAPRYDEGQPTSGSLDTPDTYYNASPDTDIVAPLRLTTQAFTELNVLAGANGNLDPGEYLNVSIPLWNYVINPIVGAATLTGITGTLSTATPGITILSSSAAYPNTAPGATSPNNTPFTILLDPFFVAGTYIDFVLSVKTATGDTELPFRVPTGTPGAPSALINENFNAAVMPALPAGWSSAIGGGPNVPWLTNNTFMAGGSPAVFHANNTGATRFIRLFSPVTATIPAALPSYLTLDFDLAYNLEDEPTKKVLAYDGLTVRVTDQTPGNLLRSVLAEAFAESNVTSGVGNHFPKHLPRSNSAAYFQDMSVWSGFSGGTKHVTMKFPGAGMTGRRVQLRFEYTEDSSGVGNPVNGTAGVGLDNIVLNYVPVISSPVSQATADLSITNTPSPSPTVAPGANITFAYVATNNGAGGAENQTISTTVPAGSTFVSATPSAGATIVSQPPFGGTGTLTMTWFGTTPASTGHTLNMVVTTPPATPEGTIISNTVTTSAATNDPIPANNTATASVTVSQADLSLTDVAAPSPTVYQGETLAFTMTATDNGPGAALDVATTTTTPTWTTFLSASGSAGAVLAPQPAVGGTGTLTGTWIGATPVLGTRTLNMLVNVLPATPPGTVITDTATTSSTVFDPNPGNNTASASVTVLPALGEVEPNNSYSTATPVPSPGMCIGRINPANDLDYWRITLPAGSTLTATLTPPNPPGNQSYFVYLYNQAGQIVAQSTRAGGAVNIASIRNNGATPFYYYVVVRCPVGVFNANSYRLNLTW